VTDWHLVPLGDVLRLRNEIVHPRDHPTGEASFVGLEHVEPHTGRRIGEKRIRLDDLTGRKSHFHPGDIVYGYLRPYLNKVWLADIDGFCSVDQYVFSVAPKADPSYVAHFMRSPSYLAIAPIHFTPGQLPRIRTDEVLTVPIPLPPVPEQRDIAARITTQLAAAGRAYRASFEAGSALNELKAGVRDATFAAVRAARYSKVGQIAGLKGLIVDGPFGSKLKTEHYALSGVRVIRLQNIGFGEFLDADAAFVPTHYASMLKSHSAEAGDVVVAALGDGARPAGRACLVPTGLGPAIVKADCFRIRTPAQLDSRFLAHWLNSRRTQAEISTLMRGATRPRFTLEMLRALDVPVIDVHLQRQLVATMDARLGHVESIIRGQQQQLGDLSDLPAAILRRAFPPVENLRLLPS
jgi:hypothetical protein